jgi:hypothetical protein
MLTPPPLRIIHKAFRHSRAVGRRHYPRSVGGPVGIPQARTLSPSSAPDSSQESGDRENTRLADRENTRLPDQAVRSSVHNLPCAVPGPPTGRIVSPTDHRIRRLCGASGNYT